MPIIYTGHTDDDGNRYVTYTNPNADAKVGRWAAAPQVPDLCYTCFGPGLRHYAADGYREETDDDGRVWRYGICRRCTD